MMQVRVVNEQDAIKYGIRLSKHTLPLLVENPKGLIGIIFDGSSDDESATIYLLGGMSEGTRIVRAANLDYWRPLSSSKIIQLQNTHFDVEPNLQKLPPKSIVLES